jgi:hypothetical protein
MNKFRFLFSFFLFVLLAQLSLQTVKAQSLIKLRSTLSVGGSSTVLTSQGKQRSVQQSVGQSSVIDSYQAKGYVLRQGFIQPANGFSTNKTNQELQASVSPNPFSSNVTVLLSETISDNIYVTLYDLFGQTIYSTKHNATQELNLDFSCLTSGIYIIKINTSRKHLTAKLIKE